MAHRAEFMGNGSLLSFGTLGALRTLGAKVAQEAVNDLHGF
jgi:hypothetical protein